MQAFDSISTKYILYDKFSDVGTGAGHFRQSSCIPIAIGLKKIIEISD
jgi:hypothetical protein